jgi:hypothetical protein
MTTISQNVESLLVDKPVTLTYKTKETSKEPIDKSNSGVVMIGSAAIYYPTKRIVKRFVHASRKVRTF